MEPADCAGYGFDAAMIESRSHMLTTITTTNRSAAGSLAPRAALLPLSLLLLSSP
jgi:hypothetical protein